jgi:hypothetical protein
MRFGNRFGVIIGLVISSIADQPISFASVPSHQTTIQGHVHTFGSHHHQIVQPAPVQAVPTVNVRDFGAVGDGVTDDTNAIQNAFNTAQASGKGVLFPAGTYLHTSTVTANSIPLFGVGGGSTLLANNPNSTALILTGVSPSIQNMVVSSIQASSGSEDTTPTHSTLLVQGAQGFVVQRITIVQGMGRVGVFLQQSAVGNASGVTFNGTGSDQDVGIQMDGCANVSLLGNLMLNEGIAVCIESLSNFVSQSIAIIGNSISTSAPLGSGICIFSATTAVNIMDVSQNQIQIPPAPGNLAISIQGANNYSVSQNITSGGVTGIFLFNQDGASGTVSQNTFRNCEATGAVLFSTSNGTLQFIGNQFGECNGALLPNTAVIDCSPSGGPDSIILLNNVYAGHANGLTDFISSSAHLNFVSGNAQTQTALPNQIP